MKTKTGYLLSSQERGFVFISLNTSKPVCGDLRRSADAFLRLSYGTGRPAVLKDDESIRDARLLCGHPLSIEDDMRLVSTVELIAIRERVHNALGPYEGPILPQHFQELQRADLDFKSWYKTWDDKFSSKYENAGMSGIVIDRYLI